MWDKGGILRPGDYIFFYGKGKEIHQLITGLCTSAAKRENFVSDRMSHIVLRGRWGSECACTK